MRVLITGGAGFIGSNTAEDLHRRGIAIAVLDNLSSGKREQVPSGVPLFVADLCDETAVYSVFREFRPTHVLHLAAQISVNRSVADPELDAMINIMGGLHVLEAARVAGARRVVFSSSGGALYGEVPDGARAAENWPVRPKSPYAASKAAFEHYLEVYRQNFGLSYCVLRYANVYGPHQDPYGEAGVVSIFSERVLAAQPVTLYARREAGDEGCVRDYVYVGDVVDANRRVIVDDIDGVFNVGTGQACTTRQLLAQIEAAAGHRARVLHSGPRPGDLEASVLESARFRGRIPLAEGIRKTVAWFSALQKPAQDTLMPPALKARS